MYANGIGTAGYPAWRGTGKSQKNGSGTSFAGQLNHVANVPKTYQIYMEEDMLWSGGNGTGLSFYIKYAENSTKDDPTVIAKGVDENGDEFEQTIHINKINPKCATVVEMRALEAHTGVKKLGGFTSLPLEAGAMGLNDRMDFMEMFQKQISDMKLLMQKKTAAYYQYSMEAYRTSTALGTRNVKPIYNTYESENYRIVPDNEAGCFDIYNKQGERLGAFDYSDIKVRQDSVAGKQFLISEHGTMSYDAILMDDELKESLQNVMSIETLETEELQGFTLKTHSGTGIQYLVRDGEEGRGGKVLLQSQADIDKYEALAETYFNQYPNLVHDENAAYIWADLEIKGVAQRMENGTVSVGAQRTSVTSRVSNVDAYMKYLESKYGKVTIKDVPKDQKTLEKLGKSMGGNDVVIAPNILEEMANDPEKAAYYEQKIDYFFDTIIPRETARCASMGLVFEPAGVVVHKDGTVTYICGCSDSPERVAQVNAINKAKREKRAALREAAFERSREEAARLRQEIELSNRRHSMAQALAGYETDVWEAMDADIFYIGLGN